MPKVSIIMNCYNSDKYLKEAIESIYAQTYQDWEIIFWDNQSTDNSANIAKSYDERLRYFYGEEHLPLGVVRNKPLDHVRGEYIAYIDCDDEWLPEKLERQVEVFENDSNVDFIYSNFIINNIKKKKKKIAHKNIQPDGDVFNSQISKYSIGFQTVMFKTELLSKVDEWFDINLNHSGEYELFLRFFGIVKANVYYIKNPLVIYRIHGANLSLTQREKFIIDFRYLIQKFTELYDVNDKDIQEGIRMLNRRADITEATIYLSSGEQKKASALLRNHRHSSLETEVQYILSKLPSSTSKLLYNFLRKIKKRNN